MDTNNSNVRDLKGKFMTNEQISAIENEVTKQLVGGFVAKLEELGAYKTGELESKIKELEMELSSKTGELKSVKETVKTLTDINKKQSDSLTDCLDKLKTAESSRAIIKGMKDKSEISGAELMGKNKQLTDENKQLKDEIKENKNQLAEQQIKLESRDKEISILENVVEKITGVKCDTEEILVKMDSININIDTSALSIDYDVLVDKLNTEGGLMVLSREEATELVNIVKANKNYLVKCTKGKNLVKDDEDTKEKIEMVIKHINNGGKANKDLADNYNISTSALIKRIDTIKKSWYELVKMYVAEGNTVTQGMKTVYEEKYSDIIRLLESR